MVLFFKTSKENVIATEVDHQLNEDEINELCWLYGDAEYLKADELKGFFVGATRDDYAVEYQCGGNHAEHEPERHYAYRGVLPREFEGCRARHDASAYV